MAFETDPYCFKNMKIYPIEYAEKVVKKNDKIVEVGCGLGRILKHYHYLGYDIVGIDNSKSAVRKLQESPELKIVLADVKKMPFESERFDTMLAFGIFHNIEKEMEEAIRETLRCLKKNGKFCISMQPNNLEMRLISLCRYFGMNMWNKKNYFYKWLVGKDEFKAILEKLCCEIIDVSYAKNVSIFWRIPFFRIDKTEIKLRSAGYELNRMGKCVDKLLTKLFPNFFFNVLIYTGRKK